MERESEPDPTRNEHAKNQQVERTNKIRLPGGKGSGAIVSHLDAALLLSPRRGVVDVRRIDAGRIVAASDSDRAVSLMEELARRVGAVSPVCQGRNVGHVVYGEFSVKG